MNSLSTNNILIACAIVSLFACIGCNNDDDIRQPLDCLSSELNNGLKVAFLFNDGSLRDDTRPDKSLIKVGNPLPISDRFGNAGCAYWFDENDALFMPEDNKILGGNDLSISLWYYLDTTITYNTSRALVSRDTVRSCPDRAGNWSIILYDRARPVFAQKNSVWYSEVENPDIIDNILEWVHVVGVKNGNSYKIYVNGELTGENEGNASCGGRDIESKDEGDLYIGHRFKGMLDDIFVYGRALSGQEIQTIYNNQSCCL